MADEVEDVKQSPEPVIEPYYQGLAKNLVDTLFDLGLLSESMSRDGIDGVEDLVGLHFQQIATSAAKCAGFGKRYKVLAGRLKKDDDDERKRHEEEMRWIARAKEVEKENAMVSAVVLKQRSEILGLQEEIERLGKLFSQKPGAWAWNRDVGDFLENILGPFFPGNMEVFRANARGLLERGMNEGILPDCRPGKEWTVSPEQDLSQEKFRPGAIHRVSNVGEPEPVPGVCPKCGERCRCESMHGFNRCQKPEGHPGTHQHRDGRHIEEWG